MIKYVGKYYDETCQYKQSSIKTKNNKYEDDDASTSKDDQGTSDKKATF